MEQVQRNTVPKWNMEQNDVPRAQNTEQNGVPRARNTEQHGVPRVWNTKGTQIRIA
jgi:hypothetical protein